MRVRLISVVVVLAAFASFPLSARAEFGLAPGGVSVTALNRDGTIDTQAGSHPYAFKVQFALNTEAGGRTEGGAMRDVHTDLSPGLVGNPEAVPRCSTQSFEGFPPHCPPATQVGVANAIQPGVGAAHGPFYNLIPPPGVAALLGFSVAELTVLISVTVSPLGGYVLHAETNNLPLEVSAVTATIWGVPADPSHDAERGFEGGLSTDAPPIAFFTLPTSCAEPPWVSFEVDSVLDPGHFVGGERVPMKDKGGNPLALSGCEAVPFSPKVRSGPSTTAAESPSGFTTRLELPNQGLLSEKEDAVTETEPEAVTVELPPGFTANPAAANGQGVCTVAQYEAASAISGPGQGCPSNSKIGTLTASTPLLEEPIEGSVYLAAPHENQFGTLIALYVVAEVPGRGVLAKQAAKVRPDLTSGQLTATFEHLPPVPYSSLELRLREGPRAPLITPTTCGPYAATAHLRPFSQPGEEVALTVPFRITSGANGASCASEEAQLPLHPTFSAGSSVPIAGTYSPFVFELGRADGEQRLASVATTLPKGFAGRIAGVPFCPDAAIATAASRSNEGEGALEAATPSCPAASRVGTVSVGAGAGPTPYVVQGSAYLAGPYKGAPLSFVFVTPAIAGPFDLGTVVVRAAIYVDETTGQITVKSDPLPQILHGLVLDVRSVSLVMDRPGFTLNPTSCEAMAVTGEAISTTGQVAQLTNRFQVGGCKGLGFKPALKLQLKGTTHRRSHPKLIATLTPRPGDANVSYAQVKLPKAAFLDNSHIKTICTRVQFAAGGGGGEQCPAGSVYGRAEATTPLLGYPLQGTVYLRSSSNPLPDLVVAFKGPSSQPIKFTLAGKTDSVNGALRNTFQSAPDVPVSKFRLELFGGKKGLIILSSGLCANRNATLKLKAHNGKEYEASPKVQADCGHAGRKKNKPLHRGHL